MKNKHRFFMLAMVGIQVAMCGLVLVLVSVMVGNISEHSEEVLREEAMTITEDRLRERVNNMILYIEMERTECLREVRAIGESFAHSMTHVPEEELEQHLETWGVELGDLHYGSALTILARDRSSGEIKQYGRGTRGIAATTQAWEAALQGAFHASVHYNGTELRIFAEAEDVDRMAKEFIYELIHTSVYGSDGYVWVNEILDYDGGKGYAIRRIHPNLLDTEGRLLSTDETDIAGQKPYLAELEGINAHGEIFHTYYFKNMSNSRISEKASYAKLYEPFDWIIATGEPLDHIYAYAEGMEDYNRSAFMNMWITMAVSLMIVFGVGVTVIVTTNRRYRRNVHEYVQSETAFDALTGARTRKAADRILKRSWEEFMRDRQRAMIMMIDIDNFKQINDTYGHNTGDAVLAQVSRALQESVRETDYLFRWGGEEFLIMFPKMDPAYHSLVAEKLLDSVRDLAFSTEAGAFGVTVSIGGAFFESSDGGFTDTVKRADTALYSSKSNGKDRYTFG